MKLFNLNIERAVLSSIVYDPMLYENVSSQIDYKDFYHPFHQKLFLAIKYFVENDKPIDEELLKEYLEAKKELNEDALLEVLASNPMSSINEYIKELKDKSSRRKLLHLSNNVKQLIENKEFVTDKVIDFIERNIYQISTDRDISEFKDAKAVITDTVQYVLEMKNRKENDLSGIDTGFSSLNKKMSGLNEGDLIIIAARPSMGKTAFGLNLAQNVIKQGKGVAFFSLEMSAEQLMLRMISAETYIPLYKLRTGSLNDKEMELFDKATKDYSNKSIYIDDTGSLDINQLKTKIRNLKKRQPEIDLIIIDYLQLMHGKGKRDRHLEVGEISRGLKLLAKELNVPIIALSQLNRMLESRSDRRPLLSDLRESGALEQDADVIIFIHREDVYKRKDLKKKAKIRGEEDIKIEEKSVEDAEIIIGKHRNGPTGVVKLYFHKNYVKFSEDPVETIIDYQGLEDSVTATEIDVPSI